MIARKCVNTLKQWLRQWDRREHEPLGWKHSLYFMISNVIVAEKTCLLQFPALINSQISQSILFLKFRFPILSFLIKMYLSHYIQEHPFSVVIRMLVQLLPKAVRYWFVCLCPKHKLTPVLQFSFLKVQRKVLNFRGRKFECHLSVIQNWLWVS